MFIIEKPYVSDFLRSTLAENKIPVLKNKSINEFNLKKETNIISEEEFIANFKSDQLPLYTNSENSIDWISSKLNFSSLPEKINLFKNKIKFRKLIKPLYPNVFFDEVNFNDLKSFCIDKIPKPFIIKPHVGFFSLGIYKISNQQDWDDFLTKIYEETEKSSQLYPEMVINSSKFIIEQNITGTEFAIDAYFNKKGEPVILNILKHIFSSEDNFEDRLYTTSKEIIEEYHDIFYNILKNIGALAELNQFPLHAEFRINENNEVIPIEINPMRFAGICVTDIAYYAYGINSYKYYFNQEKPNWSKILKGKENKTYNVILASVPIGMNAADINSFDYEGFISHFYKPLEIRKMDYKNNNVFCILFVETHKNKWKEIEYILNSDLKEFIRMETVC